MMPSAFLSSVQSMMPLRMASMGLPMTTGLPNTAISPLCILSAPKMSFISSLRPAPTSPKMPRISPRLTSNDTGALSPGPIRFATLRPASPSGLGL